MIPIQQQGWPKGPTYWCEADMLFVSIPFTWNLPEVRAMLRQSAKINQVSAKQKKRGWTDQERIKIMRHFYKAKFGGYINFL